MNLLRISNNRALSILEQAAFIDELYATGCLSVAEMAKELSRSKSWVSMRLGLISEMSAAIRAKLFSGAFASETEPAVAHSSRQIALYAVRAQYLDHDTVCMLLHSWFTSHAM